MTSTFRHQNMTPYILDIFVHKDVAADLSLSDLFSKKKFGQEEKLREYEAVNSCRLLSFHNHQPNKVGFLALHHPRMIEIRKQMLQNQHKLGISKFSNFSGQSTTAITKICGIDSTWRFDTIFKIYFSLIMNQNGAKLDQFDEQK